MKTRVVLLLIAIGLVALGVWSMSHRDPQRQPRPTPVQRDRTKEVRIQDGKTIDFSSGTAVIRDDAKEKAAIDQAVAKMDAATKDVTFPAQAAPAAKQPETRR